MKARQIKRLTHETLYIGMLAALVTTSCGNWIAGAQTYPSNPYDGDTLADALTRRSNLKDETLACYVGI